MILNKIIIIWIKPSENISFLNTKIFWMMKNIDNFIIRLIKRLIFFFSKDIKRDFLDKKNNWQKKYKKITWKIAKKKTKWKLKRRIISRMGWKENYCFLKFKCKHSILIIKKILILIFFFFNNNSNNALDIKQSNSKWTIQNKLNEWMYIF